jgi:drug/metabolite transporter (DMT)-like permease
VTALLAILSAVLVGGADFLGGLASRTASALRVAALAQAAGLPPALVLALAVHAERVSNPDVAWALGSGVAVACGFACFYSAMGRGLISVVAPLAAVTGAAVPVFYALARGERPGTVASVGIVTALAAVVIVSIAPVAPEHAHLAITPDVVGLSLLAGGCFGTFYVAFSVISEDAGLWPVALERTGATVTLVAIALALTRGALVVPARLVRLVVTIGALEVGATIPLLLALQRGPIAIASVLASLYPVTTVLLAAVVLHERMSRLQLAGTGLALVAVVLVSAG